ANLEKANKGDAEKNLENETLPLEEKAEGPVEGLSDVMAESLMETKLAKEAVAVKEESIEEEDLVKELETEVEEEKVAENEVETAIEEKEVETVSEEETVQEVEVKAEEKEETVQEVEEKVEKKEEKAYEERRATVEDNEKVEKKAESISEDKREEVAEKVAEDKKEKATVKDSAKVEGKDEVVIAVERENETSETSDSIEKGKNQKRTSACFCYKAHGQNKKFKVNKPTITIGRDAKTCDFLLRFDSRVGRKHAILSYKNNKYYILDLGSKNGTYINKVKLKGEGELKNGDQVKIADTELTFKIN
ncbi:MAG TPA: hypothetical protein DGK91_10450, partial [Clostridium sp.]|nr:hypothetical protein [Clostridium sp.]